MQVFPTLYKKTELKQIQQWSIFVEKNFYWTEEGITDGKITKSKPTYCEGKNLGRKNATNECQQAFKEAEAKWNKKKKQGYAEKGGKAICFFKPMLAFKYEDKKSKIVFPCFLQPKLNGERCILNSQGMFTRQGEKIVSCPHIINQTNVLFNEWPNLILDGELYNH